jgi:hypothetical protein
MHHGKHGTHHTCHLSTVLFIEQSVPRFQKGGLPVMSSMMVQATLQMSLPVTAPFISITSGLNQNGDPWTPTVSFLSPVTVAPLPKSEVVSVEIKCNFVTRQFYDSVFCEKNVISFDVSMEHSLTVKILQSV